MLIEETFYIGTESVWVGLYPEEDRMNIIRELLRIPENVIPFSLGVVVYPKEKIKHIKNISSTKFNVKSCDYFIC